MSAANLMHRTEPIDAAARPRLASKVRLRFDRHSDKHMLVYPERGMELNESAASIAQLCTGEYSVREIVERLVAAHAGDGVTEADVARDVQTFLAALLARALIQVDAR